MQKKIHIYNAEREKHTHANVPGTVLAMVTCFEEGEIERNCEPLVHKTSTLLKTKSTQKKEVEVQANRAMLVAAGQVGEGAEGLGGRGRSNRTNLRG